MTSDFELIFSEFSDELDAILEMANASVPSRSTHLTARARIAAGNGATLLLAATFEEYIRQQVRAAFKEKIRHAKNLGDFPAKITSTVWRRSLEKLARTPFEEIELNSRASDAQVNATLAFCLRKEMTIEVAETISHNETNMRLAELSRLFNQIGLKSIIDHLCGQEELIDFLGSDSPGKATSVLTSRFEEFFRRRNNIAHAIQLGISSGPSELEQDISLFRIFSQTLAKILEKNMQSPVREKKAKRLPRTT